MFTLRGSFTANIRRYRYVQYASEPEQRFANGRTLNLPMYSSEHQKLIHRQLAERGDVAAIPT